jgi:hypothetical protein
MILKNQFDTIYHEHLSYFLLKPIIRKLNDYGLTVFNVEEIDIHGGSLLIYASNDTTVNSVNDNVNSILEQEEIHKMYDVSTYASFRDNVEISKDMFVYMLEIIKGKKVAGYCASAKGISLINYCELDKSSIDLIADDTPDKQGKFIPGSSIMIVSLEEMRKFDPDYIILFSWNFIDELKRKLTWFNGKFIIPIPYARID